MMRLRRAVALLAMLAGAPLAWAGEAPAAAQSTGAPGNAPVDVPAGTPPDVTAATPAAPPWSLALTLYPTHVHGGERYTSAIGIAERGPVHLEARVNYESVGARSAWLGWVFSGGETVTWSFTPILGGAWGTTQSFLAGFEASTTWRQLDAYIEAEVVPTTSSSDSYVYAWSELGWRPVEWLRVGLVGQRTRARGTERELSRGLLAQVTFGAVTIGAYGFDLGSSERTVMAMLGLKL
jgi:hypothetical protein